MEEFIVDSERTLGAKCLTGFWGLTGALGFSVSLCGAALSVLSLYLLSSLQKSCYKSQHLDSVTLAVFFLLSV